MTCTACAEAQINAACHSFNKNCSACTERHFAHLQIFWESVRARDFTKAYKAALDKQFGEAGAQAAHVNVKAWYAWIRIARRLSAVV